MFRNARLKILHVSPVNIHRLATKTGRKEAIKPKLATRRVSDYGSFWVPNATLASRLSFEGKILN